MTNFLDWLATGDPGLSAERLRDEYRLSQDEMRRASEALAPAFMIGLQRLTSDASAWTSLMKEFSKLGPNRGFPGVPSFDALGPAGGPKLANAFFGSDVLASAVARQASTMSGIAPDIMMKMMPSFSLLTVQATMRMMNPALFDQKAFPSDPAGATMAEMLRRSANAVDAFSRPSDAGQRAPMVPSPPLFGMETLFADALKGGFPWMNWPTSPPARQPGANAANPFDPFGTIAPLLEVLTQGLKRPPAPETAKSVPRSSTPGGTPTKPKSDPFLQMIETGQAAQAEYAREVMALFEKHGSSRK